MIYNKPYLVYIVDCLTNIDDLVSQGRSHLETDKHKRAALLYYLQTMAETTQRLSQDLKEQYPTVDWLAIAGFRNRLVHGYLEVNMQIVWNIVERDLPGLKSTVLSMLEALDKPENPPE